MKTPTVDPKTEINNTELPESGEIRPIEDVLEELASAVPEVEWKNLPTDLTDNLDHYLYGTPKR